MSHEFDLGAIFQHSTDIQPAQRRDASPGDQLPANERRRDRERGIYPPPLTYKWTSVEEFYPVEEDQQIIRERLNEGLPGYRPKELLVPKGKIEEQRLVGIVMQAAMYVLKSAKGDFPLFEPHETPSQENTSAIGMQTFTYRYSTHDPDRTDGVVYLFSQHPNATDKQYQTARGMYIDEINGRLGEIKRNPIPLPQTPQ